MSSKPLVATGLAALLLVLAGCSRPTSADDGTKAFQGKWQLADAGQDGKQGGRLAIFEKDIVQLVEAPDVNAQEKRTETGTVEKYAFRVSESATPAQIDLVYLSGDHLGKTRPGIYVFEETTLKICLAKAGASRPTEFAGTRDATVLNLRRSN
jgi:uncharacterized protein (TIGR03067 family)